ncbi:MAG: Regulator of ribonuclease [Pseudomonadota bacterium]|jgi:hypothetical protein
MNMKWFAVLLVVVAIFSLMRIVSQWRTYGRSTVVDLDEQFIMQLRKAGVNAFEDHDVDFFFTLPDVRASATVKSAMVKDGFNVISENANPDGGYGLVMRQRMRLVVPAMQALTARFNELAAGSGGKYDSWALGTPGVAPLALRR